MKLTWFGGTTLRLHIGGQILVMDAGGAPSNIDRAELVSGADSVFELTGPGLPAIEASSWKPRRVRPLDEETPLPVELLRAADDAVLVDATGEPPLLVASGAFPPLGRWASEAVIVLFGSASSMIAAGKELLANSSPRLIALAASDADIDLAIAALRDLLDGTSLVSLEAGLALEI
jgi:hypothetical protein